MKSLNFGASVVPRMTQAASHSHVSRVDIFNGSFLACVCSARLICSDLGRKTGLWFVLYLLRRYFLAMVMLL